MLFDQLEEFRTVSSISLIFLDFFTPLRFVFDRMDLPERLLFLLGELLRTSCVTVFILPDRSIREAGSAWVWISSVEISALLSRSISTTLEPPLLSSISRSIGLASSSQDQKDPVCSS